jgi:hypothetical protein
MATVFELSEPYGNHLIPVLPIALHAAGAAKVAIVVIGRHFDRGYRNCEPYYQQAKTIRFTWDSCCLEEPPSWPESQTPIQC